MAYRIRVAKLFKLDLDMVYEGPLDLPVMKYETWEVRKAFGRATVKPGDR